MFDIETYTKRSRSFLEEFRAFAFKSNVIDLAVAVIIGTAFGRIIASLVKDVLMPVVGLALGGVNISSYVVTLRSGYVDKSGVVHEPLLMHIGAFLQAFIDFLVIALCLFIIIKIIGQVQIMMQKHEKATEDKAKKAEAGDRKIMKDIAADVALLREHIVAKAPRKR